MTFPIFRVFLEKEHDHIVLDERDPCRAPGERVERDVFCVAQHIHLSHRRPDPLLSNGY